MGRGEGEEYLSAQAGSQSVHFRPMWRLVSDKHAHPGQHRKLFPPSPSSF